MTLESTLQDVRAGMRAAADARRLARLCRLADISYNNALSIMSGRQSNPTIGTLIALRDGLVQLARERSAQGGGNSKKPEVPARV
jgi:hypothetical protein